jgi:hypothetical protein
MDDMKTPFGPKLLLAILSIGVLASSAAAVSLSLDVSDLKGRAAATKRALDELTASVLAQDERARSTRGTASGDGSGDAKRLDTFGLKLEALSRRLDALESGDGERMGIGEMVGRQGAPGRFDAAGQKPGRAQLDGLAQQLGMTDQQKRRAADVVNNARNEVVKVLDARDADGRNMAERIAEIAQGQGNRADKNRQVFAAMSGTDVPGRDESYVSAIMGIREAATADFKANLTDEQLETLSTSGINLFGIDTGYSPIAAEMKELLQGGNR